MVIDVCFDTIVVFGESTLLFSVLLCVGVSARPHRSLWVYVGVSTDVRDGRGRPSVLLSFTLSFP